MGERVSDCLIALANLRASAHACVAMLADEEDGELDRARERVSAELTGSGPIRIRYASASESERELATLCDAAGDLARACRQRRFQDEGAMLVIRRFEAAVCIAQGVVLRAYSGCEPASAVRRASSVPPDPTRQTG